MMSFKGVKRAMFMSLHQTMINHLEILPECQNATSTIMDVILIEMRDNDIRKKYLALKSSF